VNRPSIWDYLPQPEKDRIPPQDREDRQVFTGCWIFYNRNGSVSFGTETREYFGTMPAEIARAVPESVINCIACMIFEAHRNHIVEPPAELRMPTSKAVSGMDTLASRRGLRN
jgi:hypothetical protein